MPESIFGVIIGIMENQTESTVVYWGYIGIMERKMENTVLHHNWF